MSTDSGGDNFLARWSRRKVEVREQETRAAQHDDSAEELHPRGDAARDDAADGEGQPDGSELTLEDVESLTKDSDFSQFMKAAVPAEIRRLALRKLWALDPSYNLVDGLVEYGEDYSKLHETVGAVQSAYRAGKGYMNGDEDKVDEIAATEAERPISPEAPDHSDLPNAGTRAPDEDGGEAKRSPVAGPVGNPDEDDDLGDAE